MGDGARAKLSYPDARHAGPSPGQWRRAVRDGGQFSRGPTRARSCCPGAVRTLCRPLRFGTVVLNRPRGSARDLPPCVRLTLVEVAEHDPPAGVEPLHWRRLTTHNGTTGNAALPKP